MASDSPRSIGTAPYGSRIPTIPRGITTLSRTATGLAVAPNPGPLGLVVAELDGKVRLFDREGTPLSALDGPGGVVTSPRLATDGRLLAMAGDDPTGPVVVRDVERDQPILARNMETTIERLGLVSSRQLAIGAGPTIHLFDLNANEEADPITLSVPEPVNEIIATTDGRRLAACTTGGRVLAWQREDNGGFQPIALAEDGSNALATNITFAPDGRSLVAGDQDGGLRFWEWPGGALSAGSGPVAGGSRRWTSPTTADSCSRSRRTGRRRSGTFRKAAR